MAAGKSKTATGAEGDASQDDVDRPAGDYAREALSQWGKAVRLGLTAISPAGKGAEAAAKLKPSSLANGGGAGKPSLGTRLNPLKSAKGGRAGDLVDSGLSKLGPAGKAASALHAGSRLTEKLRPDGLAQKLRPGDGDDESGEGDFDHAPIPIQESIDVAVPVGVAYDLCTRFEEYPGFVAHVERANQEGGDQVAFGAKVRGTTRRLEIEIYDTIPNERIDWRSTGGIEHSGVVSFHELAPRLTHIELSVDFEPQNLVQRLSRSAHLTERTIRAEMRRFKAYAELGEDEGGDPPPQSEAGDASDEPAAGGEPEAVEPEADEELEADGEQDADDELTGEEEIEADDELEGDDELDEDEELEQEELVEEDGELEAEADEELDDEDAGLEAEAEEELDEVEEPAR